MTTRPRSVDRSLHNVFQWLVFGLLWAWIVISVTVVPGLVGLWWLGLLLGSVGLIVAWQAAKATTHPITTIGRKREVTRWAIDTQDRSCDVCGGNAVGGEGRRYASRTVLFGTTIAVDAYGTNVYCPACLEREARGTDLDLEHGNEDDAVAGLSTSRENRDPEPSLEF